MAYRVPWPRVLAEGIVIITSILLALAVDAAWSARQQRLMIHDALISLRQEFSDIQAELDRARDVHRGSVATLESMLTLMGAHPSEADGEAFAGLWPGLVATRIDLPHGVLTSILSSGNLSLVRSQALRKRLIEWPARVQDHVTSELIAMDKSRALRELIGERTPIGPGGGATNHVSAFPTRYGAVLSDFRIENQLARLVFLTRNVIKENEALGAEVAGILESLNQYLASD